jgi:hypothetical protein
MNHKFVHRSTAQTIYFSKEGAEVFSRSKKAKDFKYIGPISEKDQAKEEAEVLKAAEEKRKDKDDSFSPFSQNVASTKAVKARVRELSTEELEKEIKSRKKVMKDPDGFEDKDPDEEDEDDDDDDDNDQDDDQDNDQDDFQDLSQADKKAPAKKAAAKKSVANEPEKK